MIKWPATRSTPGHRFIERELRKLIIAGDYEAVLRYATTMCEKRENHATALYWRATALLWLRRYQEVLEIADRVETLHAEGVLKLNDEWLIVFHEFKCHALSALEEYQSLLDYSSECLERHPGTVSLASYQLLAIMPLGKLTDSTPCLQFLDNAIEKLDEAWEFLALYEAHKHLGHRERAREIAQLALAKYPDDAEIREIAKAKHSSRRTCKVRPSHNSFPGSCLRPH
jgi:tetratricopeptide (TPR) repeat protein